MFFRRNENPFADIDQAIHWDCMLTPDVVMTRTGYFMACFEYIPLDLSCASKERAESAMVALNKAIACFGTGWAFWFECQRNESVDFHKSRWPTPVSAIIDDWRRDFFGTPGVQFKSSYYVTMLYRPRTSLAGKVASLYETTSVDAGSLEYEDRLQQQTFDNGVSRFLDQLSSFMPMVRRLSEIELLTYLHSTVSTKRHKVHMPELPLLHVPSIVDMPFVPGYSPMLGNEHMRIVKIADQPDKTYAGIMDAMNFLEFSYRIVGRWLSISREDALAEIELARKSYDERVTPVKWRIAKFFGLPYDGSADDQAMALLRDQADAAKLDVSLGNRSLGYWSHAVVLTHPDETEVERRAKAVEQAINGKNFVTYDARDDSGPVWIGTIPGHPAGDRRNLKATSLSFACAIPSTAVWTGPEWDHHLDAPPLRRCLGDGATPFHFTLHQPGTDVAHGFVVGMTGAGKSTLFCAMESDCQRYENAQVDIIDNGGSARCVTLANGGEYFDLADPKNGLSWQPLAKIDDRRELGWAYNYVIKCLREDGLVCSVEQKKRIYVALRAMAKMPVEHRTFTILRSLVQDTELRSALSTFCLGGALGDLLDNDKHVSGRNARFRCFEAERLLLERPDAVGPVLACVFHEIRRNIDGRPLFVFFDEVGLGLQYQIIADEIRWIAKTGRRKNVKLWLATQELSDIDAAIKREVGKKDGLLQVISASCQTWIYTANDRAMEAGHRDVFKYFGRSDEEIELISRLQQKAEYFFTVPGASRKINLHLTPIEKAIFGANRPEDHAIMDEIVASYPPNEFLWHWMQRKMGYAQEAIAAVRDRYGEAA